MELSIIIPAYNEEQRLPTTLRKIFDHLKERYQGEFEVLVANNGSTDRTVEVVKDLGKQYPQLKVIDYRVRGRGEVCKHSVRDVSGAYVLIDDADGSTDAKFVVPFLTYIKEHSEVDIITGSRDIQGAKILTPQPPLRVFMNKVFLLMAKILFGWPMHDRVNGFKLFRREAALDIYPFQQEKSFFAEAELIYIADYRGWNVKELPIEWTDDRDSRVRPFKEALRGFVGMFKIVQRGRSGAYGSRVKNTFRT